MNSRYNSAFKIRRNLTDAGCEEQMIQDFFELGKEHRRAEQYKLLGRQKAFLLEQLHKDQYGIDCLDHMVYTMQEEDRKRSEDSK